MTSDRSVNDLRTLVWSEIDASGRTQVDICMAVGITQKHMSEYLNGHTGMSLELIDAILIELGRELIVSTRVIA